ncbi:MAG: hypothetical protein GF353_13535 [Candidatus Lokiarchaeota archaeon]|nr:hypothetical protein [Candidatus Lokiarchaeota archaeon]
MKKIEIRCPTCEKLGKIDISDDAMKNVSRGLLAINIAPETICEHSFIAYVDKNLHVRDYFTADFHIEIPQVGQEENLESTKIPEKEIINLDLIKLNLPAILITYVLRSIFYKQDVLIISDQDFLNNHIQNFFEYITKNTFDSKIVVLSKEDYKKNKKVYKKHLIIEGTKIIKDPNKIIDYKGLKLEKQIVSSFVTESELAFSYIMLKNEIKKAFRLAKTIKEFVESYDKSQEENVTEEDSRVVSFLDNLVNKEKLLLKIVSNFITTVHHQKFDKNYIRFLIDIVENYYKINVQEKLV